MQTFNILKKFINEYKKKKRLCDKHSLSYKWLFDLFLNEFSPIGYSGLVSQNYKVISAGVILHINGDGILNS